MRQRDALAYTAGIIDGEGCIGIYHSNALARKNQWRLILEVTVTNTGEWLCQWLKMQFGGGIRIHRDEALHHKKCWRWRVTSRQALSFLELVAPYLQLKRPQAELAITFQSKKRCRGSIQKSTKEIALEQAQKILLQSYK